MITNEFETSYEIINLRAMGKFEKENLPVTDIKQLESLFADLILWYDEKYCKNKEGAYEVIGEYMTSDGRDYEPSESGLNIPVTVGRSELLLSYEEWRNRQSVLHDDDEMNVAEFLQSNSC